MTLYFKLWSGLLCAFLIDFAMGVNQKDVCQSLMLPHHLDRKQNSIISKCIIIYTLSISI